MNSIDIRGGLSSITITLEQAGAVASTYTLSPNVTRAEAVDASVVMHEKPPAAADESVHAHHHNGVTCTADHSAEEKKECTKKECTKDHGHGHGDKKEQHGHGHKEHGHGHKEHDGLVISNSDWSS